MSRSNRGMGIVEVLIAVGIISVVAGGLMTLMTMQTRETRSLTEKLGALDLQQVATAAFRDGNVCKYLLRNPVVRTFNSTGPFPQTITIAAGQDKIYASALESPPGTWQLGPVVAEVDPTRDPKKAASAVAPTLFISSVALKIKAGGVLPNSFVGEWTLEFDASRLVRHIRPVTIQTTLIADTAAPYSPANAAIDSCQTGAAPPPATDGPQGSWCGWGMNYWNFWGAATINGNGNALSIVSLCKGFDPRVACPPGYSRLTMCYEADLYHNCNNMLTCLKD